MNELHRAYLSLGSNIEPEKHLSRAVEMLKVYGKVAALSRAWESRPVGGGGPNFLNACVEFVTPLSAPALVENVIRPIELALGRTRTMDKNASRQIDIDIVLYDDQPVRLEYWEQAFMIVPLAELRPEYVHPASGEPLARVSQRMRSTVWVVARPDILDGIRSG